MHGLLCESRIHVEPVLPDLVVELDELLLQLRHQLGCLVRRDGSCSAHLSELSRFLGPLLNDKFHGPRFSGSSFLGVLFLDSRSWRELAV